ncbi:MAG: hypothetical protein ACFNKE_03440 [Neisseria elongata]
MDQIKFSSYWKPAVMLPLVNSWRGCSGIWPGYWLFGCKKRLRYENAVIRFRVVYAVYGFYIADRLVVCRGSQTLQASVHCGRDIVVGAAALIVIIMWLIVVNAAALAVDQPWSVILVITTIPPLSAVAGAVASFLLPKAV